MKSGKMFNSIILIISGIGLLVSFVKLSYLNTELFFFGLGLFFISQFTIISINILRPSVNVEVSGEISKIENTTENN